MVCGVGIHLGPQETDPEKGKSLIFKGEAKNSLEQKAVVNALRKLNPSELIGSILEFIATNGECTEGKIESIKDGMFTNYTINVLSPTEFHVGISSWNLGSRRYKLGYKLTIMR